MTPDGSVSRKVSRGGLTGSRMRTWCRAASGNGMGLTWIGTPFRTPETRGRFRLDNGTIPMDANYPYNQRRDRFNTRRALLPNHCGQCPSATRILFAIDRALGDNNSKPLRSPVRSTSATISAHAQFPMAAG